MNVSDRVYPSRCFHGCRRGRPLKPSRSLLVDSFLPSLRVVPGDVSCNPSSLFSFSPREVWLEIGFGGAEHLLWQARSNLHVGLVGVEPFMNGVAKAVAGISSDGLENIRIYDGDVRDLLPFFSAGSFSRIFILFPDPWHKARHKKRRIISSMMVNELARLLIAGGELRIASDIPDYIDWILRRIYPHPAFHWPATSAHDWRVRPDDWPMTRYESKALISGRLPSYLSFLRREGVASGPFFSIPHVPFCASV